jgi:tetratricopeptide (TPR) repeat protein
MLVDLLVGNEVVKNLGLGVAGNLLTEPFRRVLARLFPASRSDLERAIAVALSAACGVNLKQAPPPEEHAVWDRLRRDALKLLESSTAASAVQEALLLGDLPVLRAAMLAFLAPLVGDAGLRDRVAGHLAAPFLAAFAETLKEESHARAWNAFLREILQETRAEVRAVLAAQAQAGEEQRAIRVQLAVALPRLEALADGREPLPDLTVSFERLAREQWEVAWLLGDLLTAEVAAASARFERVVHAEHEETRGQLGTKIEAVGDKVDALGRTIQSREPPPPLPHGASVGVPPSSPHFYDPHDLMERLRAMLVPGARIALTGLPGAGKTQAAIEYAARFRDDYAAVFWVSADRAATLAAGYAEIARRLMLRVAEAQEQERVITAVRDWLEMHPDWLLVFDNADHLKLLRPFLPDGARGSILLTRRPKRVGGFAMGIPVETLSEEEGATFLLRRAGRLSPESVLAAASDADREAALAISREVGGLFLALDQAGALIEGQSTPERYLARYRERGQELRAKRGEETLGHEESVTDTFSLAFDRLTSEGGNPLAAELLRLGAFLAPEAIPAALLRVLDASREEPPGPLVADARALEAAILAAQELALLRYDPDTESVSLHRLVQAVLRDQMTPEDRRTWLERAVRAADRAFPSAELETWSLCERLVPHVVTLSEWIEVQPVELSELALLLNRAGHYLYVQGRYGEAEPLLVQTRSLYERTLGPDDPRLATTLANLATIYRRRGQPEDALRLYRRALDIHKRAGGMLNPEVATLFDNVATLYKEQNDLTTAESFYKRALSIRRRVLGARDPYTANSILNLGAHYLRQERYKEAELLIKQARSIYEEKFGPDHYRTAASLINLGGLYYNQKRDGEAKPLLEQARRIYEDTFGPGHPDLVPVLESLALLYLGEERGDDAELLLNQALSIRKKRFGPDHLDTIETLGKLGLFYFGLGRYAEAESLAKEARSRYERALGLEHPTTASSLFNLAVIYRKQRRLADAELLYEQALAILEETLGPANPATQMARDHLAAVRQEREGGEGPLGESGASPGHAP